MLLYKLFALRQVRINEILPNRYLLKKARTEDPFDRLNLFSRNISNVLFHTTG